ncbi:hypothetical protein NCCP28_37650 [Niallia sp. NCCP-28]|nr:hypothetical protein NCCP28_37650 [Niallia sp. NCCP-28]
MLCIGIYWKLCRENKVTPYGGITNHILDGVPSAECLGQVISYLEHPYLLVL